jgi:hypothetical protein
VRNEVFGDATRGDAWAAVRLEVEGGTIIAADAPHGSTVRSRA